MPRKPRIVIPGAPHHITQRGNNCQDVFFVDDDRYVYCKLLRQQSQKYGFEIQGYCLMTNHVHIIGIPNTETSLAKAIGRTNFIYTQYINRMHGRSGHLWQNRFHSCPLDRQHFWHALSYIETNPIRANLAVDPWQYEWSSAKAHIECIDQTGMLNMKWWKAKSMHRDWKAVLKKTADKQQIENIRTSTRQGRPLVSDNMLSKIEKACGRRIRPLPVGRPKNK